MHQQEVAQLLVDLVLMEALVYVMGFQVVLAAMDLALAMQVVQLHYQNKLIVVEVVGALPLH